MKYIVIGLGSYGSVLAEELTLLGHEVIGVDLLEYRVDAIKEKIATAFVMDATDVQSLAVLPLSSVDAVIITIGENFGASIRVTALLKQKGVQPIYARATDALHKTILEGFGLGMILTPEEDAAYNLVGQLNFGTRIETFRIGKDHSVSKFVVPQRFVGYTLEELGFYEEFKLRIIALTRAGKTTNVLGFSVIESTVMDEISAKETIQAGDELICYGKNSDFQSLWKAI